MANVNITFNGKEFLLSCDDGQEEHLIELSELLNNKFANLKSQLGNITNYKIYNDRQNSINKGFDQSLISNDPKLNFIYKAVKNIKNIKILEFGVKAGISTSLFLKLCEENEGYLVSVDIDDYSNLFSNKNWHFIHSRDDNFEKNRKRNKKSKKFKRNLYR